MRYDKPIFFQYTMHGAYDPESGDYDPDTLLETKKFASVTDSGVETLNLIYGELKQGVKTIRLQRPYEEPFDRVRIGSKVYRVDFSRFGRNFVCSEVQ
jgi:hypothetical protein